MTNISNIGKNSIDSYVYGNASVSYTTTPMTKVDSSLIVNGSIKMNGTDLEERLSVIEQVLNIPTRDAIMEEKYPELKKIYEQYVKELEKYKTWQRIKESK